MLMKTKKKIIKIQKSKIFKNGQNGLEIYWIATFPQNLALICLTVPEKTRFTDGRTTDDGRPRHGISSADTVKQS